MDGYKSILMVASGFGIAAQLAYLKKLIYGYNARLVRARRIHLVWQIADKGRNPDQPQVVTNAHEASRWSRSSMNHALEEDKLDVGCLRC